MDNYIVSARKYRPTTFYSVVGQKALVQTLKAAVVTRKLAHAYLFAEPGEWEKPLAPAFLQRPSTANTLHPTGRLVTNVSRAVLSMSSARTTSSSSMPHRTTRSTKYAALSIKCAFRRNSDATRYLLSMRYTCCRRQRSMRF